MQSEDHSRRWQSIVDRRFANETTCIGFDSSFSRTALPQQKASSIGDTRVMNDLLLSLTTVALVASAVVWRRERWRVRLSQRQATFEEIRSWSCTYARRGIAGNLYDFTSAFSTGELTRGPESRAKRAMCMASLSASDRATAIAAAQQWMECVGEVAELASRRSSHGLRAFLQTFHLSLIREGSIAEPVLISQLARGEWPASLPKGSLSRYQAALAMADLARAYNAVARQQRDVVTVSQLDTNGSRYVFLRPPSRSLWPWLNLRDVTSPWFRLRRFRRRVNVARLRRAVAFASANLLDLAVDHKGRTE
jgi:hypothetical protein